MPHLFYWLTGAIVFLIVDYVLFFFFFAVWGNSLALHVIPGAGFYGAYNAWRNRKD